MQAQSSGAVARLAPLRRTTLDAPCCGRHRAGDAARHARGEAPQRRDAELAECRELIAVTGTERMAEQSKRKL